MRYDAKLGAFLVCCMVAAQAPAKADSWPCFRGPRGDGTSLETGVPVRWSATENVWWKVPIPGKGHSSPIVWADRIFLVTALEDLEERVLLCLDRRTGKTLWQQTVLRAPMEPIHELNSRASSTPATDGERIYVSFLDRDQMFIAAYDFDGKQVWAVRPGVFSSKHGYCSSPLLFKDKVIVNGDHDGDGYLVALDRKSGKTLWKTAREYNTRSYCTPIIRNLSGRTQMILSGSKCVASYDPNTGKQLWIMDGPTEQFVASPVENGRLVYITAGYPERHIVAIRTNGSGHISQDAAIAWRTRRGCSYVPSPVIVGKYFFVVSDGGFASCIDADTGDFLWYERLGGGHSASLITAEGRIYFLSDRGVMTVVKASPTYEVLAVNELGEDSFASPVISQGQILIRGLNHLYAIGKPGT